MDSTSNSPPVTFTSCVQVQHKAYQPKFDSLRNSTKQLNMNDSIGKKLFDACVLSEDPNVNQQKNEELKVSLPSIKIIGIVLLY